MEAASLPEIIVAFLAFPGGLGVVIWIVWTMVLPMFLHDSREGQAGLPKNLHHQ